MQIARDGIASIDRPLLAIWLGIPFRLSPNPFQTPVRSGCPSAVRGVAPDGFGGAFVVRRGCEDSCAIITAERRHSAAVATANRLSEARRIRTFLCVGAGFRRTRVFSVAVRIGRELELAAVGHLQLLKKTAVRSIPRGQRDDGDFVARLQPSTIGARLIPRARSWAAAAISNAHLMILPSASLTLTVSTNAG